MSLEGGRPDPRQAAAFAAAADAYELGRPTYPEAAVDWLLTLSPRRVLDLGAGTGKLTRQLATRGLDVVAVEPLSEMRAKLAQTSPGVDVRAGSAEHIPLDDHSVDAVLVAQAWHWMDPVQASREVARVLTPGGLLGLIWNVRDERAPWVARLGELMHRNARSEALAAKPVVDPPFGPLDRLEMSWTYTLSREGLISLVSSRSYVILLTPIQRDALFSQIDQLIDGDPDLKASETIPLPYVTRAFRTRLLQ